MSFRVGIILPKTISRELKNRLNNKYHIKLQEFENEMLFKYYTNREGTYQISKDGDDTNSGIGAYEICNKSLDIVYNTSMKDEIKEFFIKDFLKRKENLEKDAQKWTDIIKELSNRNDIERIGIFHFNGYDKSENIKFNSFIIKNHLNSKDIKIEDIINIYAGEIHFWRLK